MLFAEITTKLPDWAGDPTWLGNPLFNWLAALLVFAAFILLRKPAAWVMHILIRLVPWKNKETGTSVADAAIPALQLLVVTIGYNLAKSPLFLYKSAVVTVWTDRISQTLLAVFLCLLAQGIGKKLVDLSYRWSLRRQKPASETMYGFYKRMIKVGVIILGLFIVLKIWGFDISGLLAGLGIGGLALSLAAKDTLSNLLGGMTIMADKTFEIGDVISTPDLEGIVEAIGFRSSKIRTFSQALVTVPNTKLSDNFVTNFSRMGKRRVRFYIGLDYGVTPEQIRNLEVHLRERVSGHQEIPVDGFLVCLERFTINSVDILFQCFLQTTDYNLFMEQQEMILMEVMQSLEDAKLSFAWQPARIKLQPTDIR